MPPALHSYDRLSQLIGAGPLGGTPTRYGYDPMGTRRSKTRPGSSPVSSQYDRADRLTSAGTTGYTLNANGNTVARGADTFTYDQANRLKSATISEITTSYAYDGDGRRVSATVSGNTTRYVYEVAGGLPVLLDDGTRKYVWGASRLAYTVEGSGANEPVTVSHGDGFGSARALSDASGAVVQTYESDEFGIPDAGGTQGTSSQPFGFTGEQRDKETGLSYPWARLYDPQVGRFLSRDPFAGLREFPLSLNRYVYSEYDPVNWADTSGLASAGSLAAALSPPSGNRVKRQAADDECFNSPGGVPDGYVVNAACLVRLQQS